VAGAAGAELATVERTEAASRGAPLPPTDSGSAALRARLDALERALAAQAARPPFEVAPARAEHAGFLVAGEPTSFAVDVPPGLCATVVTVASGGLRDLDATLFDPDGSLLAEDVEADAHPTLQLCAAHAPRRAYVVLRAYAGAGAYVARVIPSRRAALSVIAAAVGGRPGVAPDAPPESGTGLGMHDVAAVLARVDRAMRRRGFGAHAEIFDLALDARRETWVPVEVPAGRCVSVVVAIVEDSVEAGRASSDAGRERRAIAASVTLVDDAGIPRARATTFEGAQVVQDCPGRAGRHAVILQSARAQLLRIAVYFGDVARVGGTSGLFAGERAYDEVARRPLDEAVAATRREAAAAGFVRRIASVAGTLGRGEARRHALQLALGARECARVVAVPGPGQAILAIWVNLEGSESVPGVDGGAAHGFGAGPRTSPRGGAPATVHLCPDAATASGPWKVTVDLVARAGQGSYVLLLLAGEPRPFTTPVAARAPAAEARLSDPPSGRDAAARRERDAVAGFGRDAALLDFTADGVALGFAPRLLAIEVPLASAPGSADVVRLDALPPASCARVALRHADEATPQAQSSVTVVEGTCRWASDPPPSLVLGARAGRSPRAQAGAGLVLLQVRPVADDALRVCIAQGCDATADTAAATAPADATASELAVGP
jgi:hypothetical protein